MEYPYRIPQNKTRLYALAAVCTFLFLLSLPVLLQADSLFIPDLRPFVLLAMGINAVLFALGAFQLFRQASQKEEGLTINTVGIHDKTSPQHRTIPWDEVTTIDAKVIAGNHFVVIGVTDPERFLQRAKGLLQRWGLRSNLKRHGTPIVIPTNNLKLEPHQITALLKQEFLQYRALPEDLRMELKDPIPWSLRENNLL